MKTTSHRSVRKSRQKSPLKGVLLLLLGVIFVTIAWAWTDNIIGYRGPSVWRFLNGAEFTPTGLSMEIRMKLLFGPLIFWAIGIFTTLWGLVIFVFRLILKGAAERTSKR